MNQPIQATTRRRRDTQVRLMHAAHQVIVSQGMAKTTVEAICDNAGFTRGALYSNFADLDDLLTSMLSYEYSLILNGIEIFREQKKDTFYEFVDKHNHLPPKECLELFASWLTEKIAEKAPEVSEFFIFHSEMSLYAQLNQTQAKVMLGCNKKIFETLGELFNRLGVAMGCKPKYSAQMVGETVLNLVVCSWRTYDLQPNEEYMVAFLRLVLPPVLMNLFSAD